MPPYQGSVRSLAAGAMLVAAAAVLGFGATASAAADTAYQPQAFGDAPALGGMGGQTLAGRLVAMAATPSGHGYWLTGVDGGIFSFGDAAFYGSMGGQRLNQGVVGLAATPDGGGYWQVAGDGGIFSFGDALFYGSTGGTPLNRPIVGMAATLSGRGYWLVAADGGVFSFGDARFYGSMGGTVLNRTVVGMAATPSRRGYWLVAADGGIFAFGDAGFYGSAGGLRLVQPAVGMAASPSGLGYWVATTDGGVLTFGDASFFGSMGGTPQPNPIVSITATSDGGGYWLLPSTPPPIPAGWTIPGTVIYNLITAPGSPYHPGQKVVALTFDDGPDPTWTPQVLQVLTTNGVPATFQIVGYEGAARPDLLRQEVADGMTLTNHTWTHVDLTMLPASAWPAQVDVTTQLITSVTGQPVRCLRPPYGATNSSVVSMLGQRGLAELYWDVSPNDYLRPGTQAIVSRVLGALHPGAIVGMHDGGGDRSQTVAALPAIIAGARAAGYTFVPVCN